MGLFGKKPPSGPDFAAIDSREKAEAAAARGELVPLMLMPQMFGGDDGAVNIVYVPPFAAELKERTDRNVILPLAQDGKVTSYTASPRYEGDSVVPNAIELKASNPGSFAWTIAIWGDALNTAD